MIATWLDETRGWKIVGLGTRQSGGPGRKAGFGGQHNSLRTSEQMHRQVSLRRRDLVPSGRELVLE